MSSLAPCLSVPDECPHVIIFDDADRRPLTFTGSWAWLSDRIANSPTKAHMLASVRMCLPLVALYLPVH